LRVWFVLLFVCLPFFIPSSVGFIESYYIINLDIKGLTYKRHTKTQAKSRFPIGETQLTMLFIDEKPLFSLLTSKKRTVQHICQKTQKE
jgi:hypothetical protein